MGGFVVLSQHDNLLVDYKRGFRGEPASSAGSCMIVALIDDLFFETKIRNAATGAGRELRAVRSAGDLAPEATLILVDLNASAFDAIAEIERLRSKTTARILAFVAHVDNERKERALKAGADEVLPRSAFAHRLPEILRAD